MISEELVFTHCIFMWTVVCGVCYAMCFDKLYKDASRTGKVVVVSGSCWRLCEIWTGLSELDISLCFSVFAYGRGRHGLP